jgi:hypothetical protein
MGQSTGLSADARIGHVCGGVGADSFEGIEAQRDLANLAVLLTAGERGEYLADVALSVTGTALPAPITLSGEGPLCLFRLPAGRYTVRATHGDQVRTQEVKIGEGRVEIQLRFSR